MDILRCGWLCSCVVMGPLVESIHFASNAAIALAYFWIGGVLILLSAHLYRPGFKMFYWVMAAFILVCAVGHALDSVHNPTAEAWHPVTAAISVGSAAVITRYREGLIKAAAADNLNEMILDALAQPLIVVRVSGDDLRVIHQNPAAVTGLGRDLTNQLLGEALPSHCVIQAYRQRSLMAIYRAVAQGGEFEEFDTYYPNDGLEGWYRVKAMPAGPGQALIVWTDISGERLGLEAQVLLNEVRRAIAEREFVLHYQPIIDLRTGATAGYEALIRWPLPDGSIRQPGEFLPTVERTEVMAPLCYLVTEMACAELQSWVGTERDGLHLAINLSPLTIGEVDFESKFNGVLDEYEIERPQLRIEITEQYALAAPVIPKLRRMRQTGLGISIDDFGTGFSNVAALQNTPADQLKIDRGFVANLLTSSSDQEIVKTIVGLSALFGLATVAEGVEDQATADWLRKAGVDYGQGYLWGAAGELQ